MAQRFTLLFWLLLAALPSASAVEWEFEPPRCGLAMLVQNPIGGNWALDRRLGTLNAAPEFSFPIQLVYHSARTERGLFGDQWYCPQLESSLLPRGEQVLLWKTPSGGLLGLLQDESHPSQFHDREERFTAKVAGHRTTILGRDGWEYVYAESRLELVKAPTGRLLDFSYRSGSLARVTLRDADASTSELQIDLDVDSRGRLTKLAFSGSIFRFDYEKGADGRLASIARPGVADVETISYDPKGLLARLHPPGGVPVVIQTEYAKLDRSRNPDRDPLQKKKLSNYRLIDDGTYSYSYSKDGSITASNRSGGWQSIGFQQARGTETVRNSAGEEIVRFYYRAPGRKHDGKLSRIEKNGRMVLQNFYDKRTGQLIESRDENDICTYFEYAPDGPAPDKPTRVLRGPREEGTKELVEAIEYDTRGRVLSRRELGDRITRYTYNQRGELESVIDPAGGHTAIKRDERGWPIGANEAERSESKTYDQAGRVKSQKLADGQTAEFTYDEAGNVVAVRQNGVLTTKYLRDQNGRLTGKTDALGRTTLLEYAPSGNLLSETQPNGTVTRYEYDQAGHRTAQIDGNGNRITFKYDPGGHLVEQKNALGQILTWTYDERGRLIERTNGVQKVAYRFNDKGRLKAIDYGVPGEKVIYTYDERGRVRKMATPTNSITLFYDSKNRVIARQMLRGTRERVIRYGWDAQGRKNSVVLSEKQEGASGYKLLQQTEYAYDPKGRLLEIRSNGASVCRYSYDGNARLIGREFGNGIVASYAYDIFGRQTRLELRGGPLVEPLVLAYKWDDAGQLLGRSWNKQTQLYGYDPSGQLLSVTGAQGYIPVSNSHSQLEAYRYDKAGNMLWKSEYGEQTIMTYDAANQLVSSVCGTGKVEFAYDVAGRLVTQKSEAGTQTRRYGFLDKVLVLNKPDGTRIGFDYYPDGQLAAKAPLPTELQGSAEKKSTVGAMISELLGGKSSEEPLEPNPEQSALNANLREELVWDGLALLYRNGVTYAVEPHVSGGVPLVASQGATARPEYYINDILGTTLAVVRGDLVEIAPMTAFGRPLKPATPPKPEPILPTQNPTASGQKP